MGSAFIRMKSSTGISSTVGSRLTRFCFPLTKILMYSLRIRFFAALLAGVSFFLFLYIPQGMSFVR